MSGYMMLGDGEKIPVDADIKLDDYKSPVDFPTDKPFCIMECEIGISQQGTKTITFNRKLSDEETANRIKYNYLKADEFIVSECTGEGL